MNYKYKKSNHTQSYYGDFHNQQQKIYRQLSSIIQNHKSEFMIHNNLPSSAIENIVSLEICKIMDLGHSSIPKMIQYLLQRDYLGLFELNIIQNPKAIHHSDVGKGIISIDDVSQTMPPQMYSSQTHINKYYKYLESIFTKVFGKSHSFIIQDIIDTERWLSHIYKYDDNIETMPLMTIYEIKEKYGLDMSYILDLSNTKKKIPILVCNPTGFNKITQIICSDNPEYLKILYKLRSYWAYRIILTYSWAVYDILTHIYEFRNTIHPSSIHRSLNIYYNTTFNPFSLDKYYYNTYNSIENTTVCNKLCRMYVKTYIDSIIHIKWLSNHTKKLFIDKLQNVKFKIGYNPYINIDLNTQHTSNRNTDLITLLLDYSIKIYNRKCLEIGQHVHTNINSYTVNALNHVTENTIYIPTALLMPPIYDSTKDTIYNVSRLGFIIGHELSHCLDTTGIYYDSENIYCKNTLLTTSEKKIYTKLIRRIYKYISGNILNDGVVLSKVSFINELLADITGFLLTEKIVYNYAECNKKELLPVLQLFYTQYSNLWNIHKSTTLNIDPHIHDKYRVNYVLISSYYYRQMYNIPKEYDNVFI